MANIKTSRYITLSQVYDGSQENKFSIQSIN